MYSHCSQDSPAMLKERSGIILKPQKQITDQYRRISKYEGVFAAFNFNINIHRTSGSSAQFLIMLHGGKFKYYALWKNCYFISTAMPIWRMFLTIAGKGALDLTA